MAASSDKSVSTTSSASTIAKQRVREELKKISETRIRSSDLQKLRKQIIPPETSLPKQKEIVIKKAEKHESFLETRFTSLDHLQDTIKGLETEVLRLTQESTQAQVELKRRREKLRDGLVELLRLQKLIEQIDKEIFEKTSEFQSKLVKMEQRREKILTDPNLTEDQKRELLAELDKETDELKQAHVTALSPLQSEKEKLKDEARIEAQLLQTALHDLEQDHLTAIEELEKSKIGASPSEIQKIEAQILEKQQRFENSLQVLEQSATSKKHFFDDQGRFYLNEDGVRIYKRDSHASEYMMGPDGKLLKVSEGADMLTDQDEEKHMGNYNKRKTDTKQYFKEGN